MLLVVVLVVCCGSFVGVYHDVCAGGVGDEDGVVDVDVVVDTCCVVRGVVAECFVGGYVVGVGVVDVVDDGPGVVFL